CGLQVAVLVGDLDTPGAFEDEVALAVWRADDRSWFLEPFDDGREREVLALEPVGALASAYPCGDDCGGRDPDHRQHEPRGDQEAQPRHVRRRVASTPWHVPRSTFHVPRSRLISYD